SKLAVDQTDQKVAVFELGDRWTRPAEPVEQGERLLTPNGEGWVVGDVGRNELRGWIIGVREEWVCVCGGGRVLTRKHAPGDDDRDVGGPVGDVVLCGLATGHTVLDAGEVLDNGHETAEMTAVEKEL